MKVFITQGGMMSIIEAVYHGIPILGFPFFADQHSNIKRLSQRGHAIGLSSIHFSADEFSWAVKELIDNPKYADSSNDY